MRKISLKLLPIQQKLLFGLVISGIIFILLDVISLIKFFILYNQTFRFEKTLYRGQYGYTPTQYAQENFMLPHPSSFSFFKEYWSSLHLGYEFKPLWHWYSDKVILTGIIFIGALLLFLISIIMGKVLSEQSKNSRGGE